MCREASAVAYVTAHALQRRYPPGGWSTAYSSVDLEDDAFRTPAEVARHAARLTRKAAAGGAEPWRLVTVGSLAQPYKGHDVLLDALARLDAYGVPSVLSIVGDGRQRAALAAQARALGLGARVTFARRVPPGAAVRALLDAADLFVLPSRTEGLPRALLEAMARGLPALATAVGGVPELLPAARLAPAGDAAALATRIATLCAAGTDFGAIARRDRGVADAYRSTVLGARRRAFYGTLRAAARARASARTAAPPRAAEPAGA
jgi:glycosyltransferase involved in cell wall biosynthesis